jgi:hypothetical protein|tara:strand:- start:379 stop:942 length:564 start_codon:yes stop_codon:yes gene_type:complete
MANYVLQSTAAEIDNALTKVLNPDTTPSLTDALITSQGVKSYVDAANTNSSTGLQTVVDRVNALSVPPVISHEEYRNFPLPHSQGIITFRYSHNGSGNYKYSGSATIAMHVYEEDGTRVTTTPVASHTIAIGEDPASGNFTGTFTTTTTGRLTVRPESAYYALNIGSIVVSVAVVTSNPSITNPLTV